MFCKCENSIYKGFLLCLETQAGRSFYAVCNFPIVKPDISPASQQLPGIKLPSHVSAARQSKHQLLELNVRPHTSAYLVSLMIIHIILSSAAQLAEINAVYELTLRLINKGIRLIHGQRNGLALMLEHDRLADGAVKAVCITTA